MSNRSYCNVQNLEPAREELVAVRHAIHQHPEIAFKELATARLVADKLGAWGYTVTQGVGTTGVVGTLKAGDGSRAIGIRADMDALPITERTGLAYASRNEGLMHACGHDGHTTMLLGAARYLAETRNFSGTIHLIFQPAEEAGIDCGARRMLADGLFERFPCDAVFAIHNHPGKPVRTFLFRSGPFCSASDRVTITVKGVGAHAARPHHAIDPIVAASGIVTALQTVVARNVDPTKIAVVTVGTIHGGNAMNVIAGEVTLGLSVRSFDSEVRALLQQRITDLVRSQAASFGASAEVDYQLGHPVLVNTERETELARQVAEELVGTENVVPHVEQTTGSEDFAYMLQRRPGCLIRLGNGSGDNVPLLHTPSYDFNDDNLTVGAAYWVRLAERFLDS